jgi:hypothetical protein
MRNTRRLMLVLGAALVFLVTWSALVSMRSQGQKSPPSNDHAQQIKTEHEGRFPIADYSAPEPTDPQERTKRQSKDNRFPKGRLDDSDGVTETLIVDANGLERLPALPVALSDVIIVGDVLNAKAYLSSNKTGLFSEFTISIHEVLKTTEDSPVLPGANISVEREGARIRYPTGHVRWVRFAHEGMPSIGGRYVFFLKRSGQGGIHTILTGYELRDGHAFPLDGVAEFESKLPQFAAYAGVEETVFLTTVRGLLH